MNLFKKQKEKGLSSGQAHSAEKIAAKILQGQRRAADYLNGKTRGISARGWMILLVCFCALFGSYCLWLLAQAIN